MKAYELYLLDPVEGYELIGVLPERRKDRKRVTEESVTIWAKMILGSSDLKDRSILFKEIVLPTLPVERKTKTENPLVLKYPVLVNKMQPH